MLGGSGPTESATKAYLRTSNAMPKAKQAIIGADILGPVPRGLGFPSSACAFEGNNILHFYHSQSMKG